MEERPHLYIIPIVHTYADMRSLRDRTPFDERYEVATTRYWVGTEGR
ncbi:hypothetical protein HYS91_05515 [Candidatus Daviesbacteria bacterium]|nr:hypothetical protein [Candidatus Daviesbacteria bacterium]